MSTETQIPAVFNPSRDGQDNTINRTLYGQVLRFPTLPPAHLIFEGVTVFDQETKDFYECQHIVTDTEDYYEWVAVTFGAARVFLIPVGKLTELDISTLEDNTAETFLDHTGLEVTDKSFIEHVAGTINELIYGFFRYHRYFTYLGYQAVPKDTTFENGVTYYTFQQNDLIDIFIDATKGDAERHKVYVGEMKPLTVAPTGAVAEDYTYFVKLSSDPNMTQCATVLNQIIALLNKHGAGINTIRIPEQWDVTDYRLIAKTLNEVVEEVDPFAVPWQVVINRIWHLEQKVGNGILVPNEDIEPVDFAGVWFVKSHDLGWKNVPADVQQALEYATICQIDDTIFKIIKAMDDIIGNLITFLSAEGNKYHQSFPTLVAYLEWAVAKIPILEEKVEICLEGIRQLRRSLGDLGFIVATDTTFGDGSYYIWNNDNAMMDLLLKEDVYDTEDPTILVKERDYNVGDNIADWIAGHDDAIVYTFVSEDTAEALIKLNAYNIAINRENIELLKAIVGTTFSITEDVTFDSAKTYFKMTRDGYVILRPGTATQVHDGDADYVNDSNIEDMPFKVYERDRSYGEKFYIETISIPVVINNVEQQLYWCDVQPDFEGHDPQTEPDYGCKKNTRFVPLLPEDLANKTYQEVYEQYGPIFVLAKPRVITEIVEMNNREIAALNRRHSTRITWIEKTMNLRPNRLKELTGVEGVTAELDTWHVDGYKKVVLPCSSRWKYFGAYRHYYRKVVAGDTDYVTHFIKKWRVTTDEFFKENKAYYKPHRIPPYNEPDEEDWQLLQVGTQEQVQAGTADYYVGMAVPRIDPEQITLMDLNENPDLCDDIIVEIQDTYYQHYPFLFVELIQGTPEEVAAGTADYSLPGYVLTKDTTFDKSKVYYHKNVAGQFTKATGGSYQQFQAGNCTYWVATAYPSQALNMEEGRVFYSIDVKGIKGYARLIKGRDYQVGDVVSISPAVYEPTSMNISAYNGEVYEVVNLSYVPASGKFVAGKVYYERVQGDPIEDTDPVEYDYTFNRLKSGSLAEYNAGECDYWVNEAVPTSDHYYLNDKDYYVLDELGLAGFFRLVPGYDYQYEDPVTGGIYEYGSQTIPDNEYYEKANGTKINRWSNVWVRDRRWKEYNTHRGLIDRNTDDLIAHQLMFGQFKDWTEGQIAAIKDFILYLMLATLEIVTQENSTFSILHNTTAKLITILNAIAKLENNLTFKHADGVYDGAYAYYRAIAFDLTHDNVFKPGKTYFVEDYEKTTDSMFESDREYFRLSGVNYTRLTPGVDYLIGQSVSDLRYDVYTTTYREAIVSKNVEIPAGGRYYEPADFRKLDPNTELDIGLEVAPRTYTLDLVMPTVENYTITEIKDAVNRVLRDHMCDPSIPLYTALPTDQPIEAHMTYYRYVDGEWEKIEPGVDDPDMIGQRMKEYDPEHVWYIKTDQEIPDQGYTMTWIRIMMNEMIRFHNKGAEKFNNAFANFVANNQDEADAEPDEE